MWGPAARPPDPSPAPAGLMHSLRRSPPLPGSGGPLSVCFPSPRSGMTRGWGWPECRCSWLLEPPGRPGPVCRCGGPISAVPLRVLWEEPRSGGSERLSSSLVSWPRQDRKPGRSLYDRPLPRSWERQHPRVPRATLGLIRTGWAHKGWGSRLGGAGAKRKPIGPGSPCPAPGGCGGRVLTPDSPGTHW